MEFKSPWVLILIPFVLGGVLFWMKRCAKTNVHFPSRQPFAGITPSLKMRLAFVPLALRLIVISLFLVALAGPRTVSKETVHKTEGIDIVLTIDASGSMAAEDFKENGQRKNRLAVVKDVVKDFIAQRHNDRMGLVAFSGEAYTVTPLTTDYAWLNENLQRIKLGMMKDGTAIGPALMTSISRLKNSKAKEKVIILLTDGVNNDMSIDPVEAARVAAAFHIRIYTIGAGVRGYAPFPVTDFFGRKVYQKVWFDIDETTLKKIAQITGGKFFRATDTETLRGVYSQIDKLEKTEFKEIGYMEYNEIFPYVLALALILLGLEQVLSNTLFLRIP